MRSLMMPARGLLAEGKYLDALRGCMWRGIWFRWCCTATVTGFSPSTM